MFKKQIERLGRASLEIEGLGRGVLPDAPGKGGKGSNRFARRPKLDAWTAGGTRPTTDRGQTFHFSIYSVGKASSPSSSWRSETAAGSHQLYIERPAAVERADKETWASADPDMRLSGGPTGGGARPSSEGDFTRPEATGEPELLSFGTLGGSRREREGFWGRVERSERRNGRVQHRIIAELPYDLDQAGRLALARDFCRAFEERGFPYHCALHAPGKDNDPRNFHLHAVFYDKESRRAADGSWDFEFSEEIVEKNRRRRVVHPYRANKDREAQGKGWVLSLRRLYADVANYHLSSAGLERRYDARSYKDSGLAKAPTRHLGTKAAVVEKQGVATRVGLANVAAEVKWRLESGGAAFAERGRHAAHIARRLSALEAAGGGAWGHAGFTAAAALLDEHSGLCREGVEVARKKETHLIAKEALTLRARARAAFVGEQGERLLLRPPPGREPEAWRIAAVLIQEGGVIDRTREELSDFVRGCAGVVSRQGRRLSAIERRQDAIVVRLLEIERGLLEDAARNRGGDELEAASSLQERMELAWRIGDAAGRSGAESEAKKTQGGGARGGSAGGEGEGEGGEGEARTTTFFDEPVFMDDEGFSQAVAAQVESSRRRAEREAGLGGAAGAEPETKDGARAEATPSAEAAARNPSPRSSPEGADTKEDVRREPSAEKPKGKRAKRAEELEKMAEAVAERLAGLPLFASLGPDGTVAAEAPSESTPGAERPGSRIGAARRGAEEESAKTVDPMTAALRAMGVGGRTEKPESFGAAGALELPPDAGLAALRRFDSFLDAMDNAELRSRAFLTRDASDLTEDSRRRERHSAAWEAVRAMAKRRGLDLDTGAHDPSKATDPRRARLHTDGIKTVPARAPSRLPRRGFVPGAGTDPHGDDGDERGR